MQRKNLLFLLLFFAFPGFVFAMEVPSYPIVFGQSVNNTLPSYAFYLFNLGTAIGFFAVFISLIWAGVLYILSPIDPKAEMLYNAKDRVSGAVVGLLILALTYLIITTINPQLSILNWGQLSKTPDAPPPPPPPGISFFNGRNCPEQEITQPTTASVADFGAKITNKINSIKTQKDLSSGAAYVAILYDQVGFKGKCQYLNPNQECQNVSPFAASASILSYNFSPSGDGVYFYRKSFFNSNGGYYYVPNSEIKGLFEAKLEDLKFKEVPEEEQDCLKFEDNGQCSKDGRQPPSLAGQNISSIKIQGNYIVLLSYVPDGNCASPSADFCQEFPATDDVNKMGPQQIKWEHIRNGGIVPNCVNIIPISQ